MGVEHEGCCSADARHRGRLAVGRALPVVQITHGRRQLRPHHLRSQIMGGRACIRGMRIPVSVVVGQIAHGATFDDILAGYPDLERDDIQQAIEYAAWLAQEQVVLS
jgi:uncharacterized protein (DUF433 family)